MYHILIQRAGRVGRVACGPWRCMAVRLCARGVWAASLGAPGVWRARECPVLILPAPGLTLASPGSVLSDTLSQEGELKLTQSSRRCGVEGRRRGVAGRRCRVACRSGGARRSHCRCRSGSLLIFERRLHRRLYLLDLAHQRRSFLGAFLCRAQLGKQLLLFQDARLECLILLPQQARRLGLGRCPTTRSGASACRHRGWRGASCWRGANHRRLRSWWHDATSRGKGTRVAPFHRHTITACDLCTHASTAACMRAGVGGMSVIPAPP